MASDYSFGTNTAEKDDLTGEEILPQITEKDLDDSLAAGEDTTTPTSNLFDEFREQLSKPAQEDESKELWLPVLGGNRKGMEMGFDVAISYDKIERWMKTCTNRRRNTVDLRKLGMIMITATNIGIKYKNVIMKDPMGDNLTVASDHLKKLTKSLDKIAVIKWIYGPDNDGEIIRIGTEISNAAGYGDIDYEEIEDENDIDDPLE